MKDLAIKKLNEELKALKKTDRHIAVMKKPVHDALVDFFAGRMPSLRRPSARAGASRTAWRW